MEEPLTLFQRIIRREIPAIVEYEDALTIVIRDRNPQAPVHCLIIPKKPIPRVSGMTEEDSEALSHLFLVAKILAEKLNVQDFRLVVNNGPSAGETIPHLHLHFLSGRSFQWPPG
jgi:histidine triad (HIT) family protein